MSLTQIIHLLALGTWIGVVGAEFAIESDGMKNDESYIRASKLHAQWCRLAIRFDRLARKPIT